MLAGASAGKDVESSSTLSLGTDSNQALLVVFLRLRLGSTMVQTLMGRIVPDARAACACWCWQQQMQWLSSRSRRTGSRTVASRSRSQALRLASRLVRRADPSFTPSAPEPRTSTQGPRTPSVESEQKRIGAKSLGGRNLASGLSWSGRSKSNGRAPSKESKGGGKEERARVRAAGGLRFAGDGGERVGYRRVRRSLGSVAEYRTSRTC